MRYFSLTLVSLLGLLACTSDDDTTGADGGAASAADGAVADAAEPSVDVDAGDSSDAGPVAKSDPDLVTRSTDDALPSSLYNSGYPDMTPDGRFVVFESSETSLVAPASNGVSQIFLRDREKETTTLISANTDGEQGNKASNRATISDDGCVVAFHSLADNLTAADNNDASDVFVRDVCGSGGAKTSLVSVDEDGAPLQYASQIGAVSGDGAFVAFENDDSAGTGSIYVYAAATRKSVLVAQGNFASRSPAISNDGKRVAFWSYASDLVAGDDNGMWDIFLYDSEASPKLSIVSSDKDGVAQTQGSEGISTVTEPAISGNGRIVAFRSRTDSLVPDVTGGFSQVYVKNTINGSIRLASVSNTGELGDADSSGSGQGLRPSLNLDGTWVAFVTNATNLAAETEGNVPNVVAHSMESGQTVGFTTATGDNPPVISGDTHGRFIAMYSTGELDPRFESAGVFVIER